METTERSLKELYQVLIDNTPEAYFVDGICNSISKLCFYNLISRYEYSILSMDFRTRRPQFFSKFYWHYTILFNGSSVYWWKRSPAGAKERVKYIKHIINSL